MGGTSWSIRVRGPSVWSDLATGLELETTNLWVSRRVEPGDSVLGRSVPIEGGRCPRARGSRPLAMRPPPWRLILPPAARRGPAAPVRRFPFTTDVNESPLTKDVPTVSRDLVLSSPVAMGAPAARERSCWSHAAREVDWSCPPRQEGWTRLPSWWPSPVVAATLLEPDVLRLEHRLDLRPPLASGLGRRGDRTGGRGVSTASWRAS